MGTPAVSLPKATPDMLHLDRQLCFLLYKASGRMTQIYRPVLEPLGLTYPQYLVMLALWEKEDRTIGELGRLLELEIGTLSPMLKRMDASGLLRRRRDAQDERRVTVALTAKGRALRDKALDAVPPALACRLTMPVEELIGLHGQLSNLLKTLDLRA